MIDLPLINVAEEIGIAPMGKTIENKKNNYGVCSGAVIIFFIAVLLRLWQWHLLAPYLGPLVTESPVFTLEQFLPVDLWRANFYSALLYLQQAPPIPNLIFGFVVSVTDNLFLRAKALIFLSGFISCVGGVLFYSLLMILRCGRIPSFLVALVFVCSENLLACEYASLGQYFYEQLSMMECLLVAVCGLLLLSSHAAKHAVALGSAATLLALTRATFSYIEIVVLVWLVFQWRRNIYERKQLLIWFLLPVILFHGGWSGKQWLVQKNWQWATSTWGGANINAGEHRRGLVDKSPFGQDPANSLLGYSRREDETVGTCLARWREAVQGSSYGVIFFVSDSALNPVDINTGPSALARATDADAIRARGSAVRLDSAAFRELSSCAQKIYIKQWIENPLHTLSAWWLSYDQFWSPIESFQQQAPTVLVPEKLIWGDLMSSPVWTRYLSTLRPTGYRLLQGRPNYFLPMSAAKSIPVKVLGFSTITKAFTFIAMVTVHLGFAALVLKFFVFRNGSLILPHGFSLLVLLYLYLAVLSNLVEYGENTRFRLEVEPIIWAMAMLFLRSLQLLSEKLRRSE